MNRPVPRRGTYCNDSCFSIAADFIFLSHSGSAFRSEVLDPGSGSVVIAQDLEHGFPIAPRLQASAWLLDQWHAELTYFGTDAWDSDARIRNVPPLPDLAADINFSAELHNVELNFRRGPSWIGSHWLLGVRYLTYKDSFVEAFRLDSGIGPVINETASGEADNSLFGPQIGLLLDVGSGCTQLRIGSKLGLMNNRINQSGPAFDNAITIDGIPETRFVNDSDEFALLGEFGLTLNHHVTRQLTLRLGYQGIFLDNIAQSATQNGQQANPENLWVHGALFGVLWSR